tara:strand:+ start:600 stop:824 length:225 start_codon:yes stop_codon:yes gene_type:complete
MPSALLSMKSASIILDDDRQHKLLKISDATAGITSTVQVAGQTFEVEQRKVSASKIAQALLNAAIDDAYALLPQ